MPESGELALLTEELDTILATMAEIDGGRAVPLPTTIPGRWVSYDPEGIVTTLQALERYGLVTLDGNAWDPGDRTE